MSIGDSIETGCWRKVAVDGLWEKRDIEGERGERGRRVKTTFGNRIRRAEEEEDFLPLFFERVSCKRRRFFSFFFWEMR